MWPQRTEGACDRVLELGRGRPKAGTKWHQPSSSRETSPNKSSRQRQQTACSMFPARKLEHAPTHPDGLNHRFPGSPCKTGPSGRDPLGVITVLPPTPPGTSRSLIAAFGKRGGRLSHVLQPKQVRGLVGGLDWWFDF